MRLMLNLIACATLCLSAAAQTPAAPKSAPAPPPCDGVVVVVRLSEIKPGGSIDKFLAAAAAQQDWYRAHGVTDNQIVTARIVAHDLDNDAYAYSDKEVISYHINPPTANLARDAGFDAFVKLFQETSIIKESYTTCMPKTMIGTGPTMMPATK
jgi:hypothetical protein